MKHFKIRPVWFVVSAPSGGGKTTLCTRLLDEFENLHYSVSCTTREPRITETDGRSYHFLSPQAFEKKLHSDAFLETAEVHGSLYGTLKSTLIDNLSQGLDVLMDLDVQGAANMRRYLASPDCDPMLKQSYVDVFIEPPSIEILRERLIKRAEDSQDVIERRVVNAVGEIAHWADYKYIVINDQLNSAYDVLRSIYVSAHYQTG